MTAVGVAKKSRRFNPRTFLSTIDGGRPIVAFPKKQTKAHLSYLGTAVGSDKAGVQPICQLTPCACVLPDCAR
jgi:hypothetical protein